jgi:hypothetical protein
LFSRKVARDLSTIRLKARNIKECTEWMKAIKTRYRTDAEQESNQILLAEMMIAETEKDIFMEDMTQLSSLTDFEGMVNNR